MIRVVALHPGFLTIVQSREEGGDLVIPLSYPDAKELLHALMATFPQEVQP